MPETKNPFLQPFIPDSTKRDSFFAQSVQKKEVEALTPLIPVGTDQKNPFEVPNSKVPITFPSMTTDFATILKTMPAFFIPKPTEAE